MLRDTFVDTLMRRLGNNNDVTLRNDIIAEMVVAQETVLEGDVFKPWFLVSEETEGFTTTAEERVSLPHDFLMLWEEAGLNLYDTTLDDPYINMPREDWADMKENLDFSGIPTHFDLAGEYFVVRPVPDAQYTLQFWYYAKAISLAGDYADASTNIENKWLEFASDWMFGEVGAVIAEMYLEMPAAKVASFKAQAGRGRGRIMLLNIAQQEATKERIMGG